MSHRVLSNGLYVETLAREREEAPEQPRDPLYAQHVMAEFPDVNPLAVAEGEAAWQKREALARLTSGSAIINSKGWLLFTGQDNWPAHALGRDGLLQCLKQLSVVVASEMLPQELRWVLRQVATSCLQSAQREIETSARHFHENASAIAFSLTIDTCRRPGVHERREGREIRERDETGLHLAAATAHSHAAEFFDMLPHERGIISAGEHSRLALDHQGHTGRSMQWEGMGTIDRFGERGVNQKFEWRGRLAREHDDALFNVAASFIELGNRFLKASRLADHEIAAPIFNPTRVRHDIDVVMGTAHRFSKRDEIQLGQARSNEWVNERPKNFI